jgi:hypothetical protein
VFFAKHDNSVIPVLLEGFNLRPLSEIENGLLYSFSKYQHLIVPKQVINDKSRGEDLAINQCIS